MVAPHASGNGTGNRILDGLDPADYEDFRPHLTPRELVLREILVERGGRVREVFFPTDGLISLVSVMQDGASVAMAAIGREGVAFAPAVLGAGRTLGYEAVTQIPGSSLVMDAGDFLERAGAPGRFHDLVERFTHALFVMVGQNAACNRLHSMTERTCRWLLLARDRMSSDVFPLTHEFLAQMLGVRRASVSEVAETLRGEGVIRYQRGIVTILDRARIEQMACECYDVTVTAFNAAYD